MAGLYYFFLVVVFLVVLVVALFFAGIALYSLYSATKQVYANSAEIAVIKPAISPSENTANNKIDTTKTAVYPIFLDKTLNSLSNISSPYDSFGRLYYTNVFYIFPQKIPPSSGGIKQGDMKNILFTKLLVRPVLLSLESGQMMIVD